MKRYFLTKIQIEGFRGINNEGNPLCLEFKSDHVNSIFGANGLGKSSIFGAISYAIRGNIQILHQLPYQERSERYYTNLFHSKQKAKIELEFEVDDDTQTKVSVLVELDKDGNRHVSSPSKYPDPQELLNSLNEEFTLIDYRTFSRFIENTPLERGRSFSSLLGLSKYADLRQSFQVVSDTRSLKSDFEIEILGEKLNSTVNVKINVLENIKTNYKTVTGSELEDVDCLESYSEKVVISLRREQILNSHFKGKTLSQIDFQEVNEAIQVEEGGETSQMLFDTNSKLTTLKKLELIDEEVLEAEQQGIILLIDKKNRLIKDTKGELFKQLYELAASLIDSENWEEEKKCPLCLSSLDEPLKAHIDVELGKYIEVNNITNQIIAIGKKMKLLKQIVELEGCEFLEIGEDARIGSKLRDKVNAGELTKHDLEAAKKRLNEVQVKLISKIDKLEKQRDELEKKLPNSLVKLAEKVEAARQFSENLNQYEIIREEESKISKKLEIRNQWKKFIIQATKLFSEAESNLAKNKIVAIDSDYKSMFKKIMNNDEIVPNLQRVKSKEDLNLQLNYFHGRRELHAIPLLSESYRNALAISVFLAAVKNHNGASRFIVLDDITSSFDAGHQLILMELIKDSLQYNNGDQGIQFIILSHDQLLNNYFTRMNYETKWFSQVLSGDTPNSTLYVRDQDFNKMKKQIDELLSKGEAQYAGLLVRQYLEFKLLQIIRKLNIPVPIDFALKNTNQTIGNSLSAINTAVEIHKNLDDLVLNDIQYKKLKNIFMPSVVANLLAHCGTEASGSSLATNVLREIVQSIDDFAECFCRDDNSKGRKYKKWYKSLTRKT